MKGSITMDLFEQYLSKKETSKWVKRALTDKSYRKNNPQLCEKDINTDLATYGDAVIKLCFCEILLDKTDKLTNEKSKYESDKYLVDVVAKHYDLLRYIDMDNEDEKIAADYNYDKYKSKNRNRAKYIATAVEAMIGAIYKETNNLKELTKLLQGWMYFSDNN